MSKKRSKKAGLPPGSLVFLGEQHVEKPIITVFDYNAEGFRETTVFSAKECVPFVKTDTITWINIIGLHDTELIKQMGETFTIHPLILEDILNTGQRPKFIDHESILFCVLRMLYRQTPGATDITSEQVSILIGKGFVLTFQEMEGDVFDAIRNRIRSSNGRLRQLGCDYLAYTLLDAIVDNYFIVLEDFDDKIDFLQQEVLVAPVPATLQKIHEFKRELVSVRRQLWPLREAIGAMQKSESPFITKALSPYLHDVYEHTFQILDTLESMREMIASALETYMSSVSNRMNEIMKVLTVISTIFIPLTFVTGIYGMNFKYMPELEMPMGYVTILTIMAFIATGMVLFFKRKNWF